jgi:hypothetical protein
MEDWRSTFLGLKIILKILFKLNTALRVGFLILFSNYPEYGFIQTKDDFS